MVYFRTIVGHTCPRYDVSIASTIYYNLRFDGGYAVFIANYNVVNPASGCYNIYQLRVVKDMCPMFHQETISDEFEAFNATHPEGN